MHEPCIGPGYHARRNGPLKPGETVGLETKEMGLSLGWLACRWALNWAQNGPHFNSKNWPPDGPRTKIKLALGPTKIGKKNNK